MVSAAVTQKPADTYLVGQKDTSMSTTNPQLLRQFAAEIVQEAFRQRAKGSSTRFEDLRRGFASKPTAPDATSSAQLQHLLVALTHQISLLDGHSISLVKTIISMNWLGRSMTFVQVYTRFLGGLVSSHAEYSTMVIQMLVQHMTLLHHSLGRIPNHVDVSRDEMYSRVHAALSYVLELVPFAKESLIAVVVAEFPHKSEKVLAQTVYIENLLKMTTYVPSIEGMTLGVIIEKIISIDVEIQVDLDDLEPEDGDAITDGAESVDGVDSEDDQAVELTYLNEDEVIEEFEAPNMTVQIINENIRKLDSVLAILFEHLERKFSNLPKYTEMPHPRFALAEMTFESLLRALDNTILKTYQSRYTQFILFWSSQMHPDFTELFLGVILERALDSTRPSTHRMIAASYIGSFTARAATLDRITIRMLTGMISRWLNAFLDGKEGERTSSRDAVKRFGIFYAMIQALFYVFCFRWRELSGLTDAVPEEVASPGGTWMPGLQRTIERAIYHRALNPLKYCNSAIIEQFAKVSHHLDFVFCGTIIQANKRTSQNGVGEIDSYFPFDPYGLTRSRSFVDKVYQPWTPIPGMEEDDDDDDSDMEE